MPANKGFYTRRRVDKNHSEIVGTLKSIGCSVLSLADKGHGVPDLLVGFRGRNYLVEVKSEKGKLTPDQEIFFQTWKGQTMVFRNAEEIIEFFKLPSKYDTP